MNSRKVTIFGAVFFVAGAVSASSAASGADNLSKLSLCRRDAIHRRIFPVQFRAHLQLDGKAVTLAKRLALSGSRYSGSGVTLRITRAGATTLKHAKRPVTAYEQT